jgi:hypothetical protein
MKLCSGASINDADQDTAVQVIDVCALAQSGVACPAKQVFGLPRGLPRPEQRSIRERTELNA